MSSTLEIFADASIRTYPDGRTFGCAGAYAIPLDISMYRISQDTTNNRSELLAIYIGCKLARDILLTYPDTFDKVVLYSDSQFAIFGLTKWMDAWLLTRDENGIIYSVSTKKPVKNQELFLCIIQFLIDNNLQIHFRHCAGHVDYNKPDKLKYANELYQKSNNESLRPEEIYKISYYNNVVDQESRSQLKSVIPSLYPIQNYYANIAAMRKYDISNYKDHVLYNLEG